MCLCEFIKPCFEFQRNLKRPSSNKNRTENTLYLSHTQAHTYHSRNHCIAQKKKADPTTQCKYTNNWLALLLFKINSRILCIDYDSFLLCNLLETTNSNRHTHLQTHSAIHSFVRFVGSLVRSFNYTNINDSHWKMYKWDQIEAVLPSHWQTLKGFTIVNLACLIAESKHG